MTQRSRTLLWATLGLTGLIGLGLYAYYGVHVKSQKEARARLEARQILKLDKDQVTALAVELYGKQTKVERTGQDPMQFATWTMVEPLETPGDNIAINGLLGTVERLESERVLDDTQGVERKTYGLDPPRGKLTLWRGQDPAVVLLVGKKSSFDDLLYVQVEGEQAVYLVKGYQQDSLMKNTYSLRLKELMPIRRKQATRLVIKNGRQTIDLRKQEDGWNMTSPLVDQADPDAVQDLLENMATLKANAFRDNTDVALSHYGLEPPALELKAYAGPDQPVLRVGLGQGDLRPGRDTYFARSLEPPGPVAEILQQQFEAFQKTPFDFRSRRLWEFENESVFKVKSASQEELLVLEKSRPDGGEVSWSLVAPRAAPLERDRAEDLLQALSDLRASQFHGDKAHKDLSSFGLDRPHRTITLYNQEGKPLVELQIGKAVDHGRFVISTRRTQVCQVNAARIDEILNKFGEIAGEDSPGGDPEKP